MGFNFIFWYCWNEGNKKNWIYVYVFYNKIFKIKSLVKKKVVFEIILKFLKNIVVSNL